MNIIIYEKHEDKRLFIQAIIQEIILDEALGMYVTMVTGDDQQMISECEQTKEAQNVYILSTNTLEQELCIGLGEAIRSKDPSAYIVLVSDDAHTTYLSFKHRLEVFESILYETVGSLEPRLREALTKIHSQITSNNFTFWQGKLEKKCIPLDSIIAFRTSNKAHEVELELDSGVFSFRGALKEVAMQLDQRFVRCHRSVIINANKIIELNKKHHYVVTKNERSYKISDSGCNKLNKKLC